MIYCYFKDKKEVQCDKEATFDDCWCSPEHKKAWQMENASYVLKENGKPKLTIPQMQERLKQMALEKGSGKLFPEENA